MEIGFELTGIPGKRSGVQFHRKNSWSVGRIRRVGNNLRLLLKIFPEFHDDCGAIECASPVYKRGQERKMDEFYERQTAILRSFGVHPKHNDFVCGGNHWTFSFQDKSREEEYELFLKLARDLINRPYLHWIFTEPDDLENCNSFLFQYGFRTTVERVRYTEEELENAKDKTGTYLPTLGSKALSFYLKEEYKRDSKGEICVNKNGPLTIYMFEFRGFEAPLNLKEFRLQREFLYKYIDLVLSRPRVAIDPTWINYTKMSCAEIIKHFKWLCEDIGIDYKKYEFLVDRNLRPRWELGRERL